MSLYAVMSLFSCLVWFCIAFSTSILVWSSFMSFMAVCEMYMLGAYGWYASLGYFLVSLSIILLYTLSMSVVYPLKVTNSGLFFLLWK